jgi:hypothetical protein
MKPLIVLILCASLGFTEPAIRGFTADDLKTERDREAQAKAVPQPERIRGYV